MNTAQEMEILGFSVNWNKSQISPIGCNISMKNYENWDFAWCLHFLKNELII